MAFRSSTRLAYATSGTGNISVPPGAANLDIAVVQYYLESAATITAPSGFTQKDDVNANPTTQGREVVFWKRLTGADSGTYNFSHASVGHEVTCTLFSGRITTGDPFRDTSKADAGSGGRTVTCAAITAGAGDDLIGLGASWNGAVPNWVAPSMTIRQGTVSGYDAMVATQDNVSAGSTGTRTFSYTGGTAGGMKGFLGALMPATSTTPVSTTRSISWDTDLAVAATRGISFDTDAPVPITRTASWNTRAQVPVTRSLSWTTRLSVAATRAMSWNIKGAVGIARTLIWDTTGTLTSVAITRTLSWAAEAQIALTRSLSWNTKSQVTPTRSVSWAVKQLVARTRTLSWTTKANVAATRSVSFSVKQSVGQTRTISYDVMVAVGPGVATIYVAGEGGTLQPATLVGVWDGTAIVPASVRSVT